MRVFMFSFRNCRGEVGGSAGVNYKLYLANKKYQEIKNMYHIFEDRILTENDTECIFCPSSIYKERQWKEKVRNLMRHISVLNIFAFQIKIGRAKRWLKVLNKRLRFTEEDIYIFHDVESAYAFIQDYKYGKKALVYHQQGSLYAEWKAFWRIDSKIFHRYLNMILEKTLSNMKNVAFPSFGAEKELYKSDPMLRKNGYHREILYNGFTKPSTLIVSERIKEIVDRVQENIVFITVAKLNYAKAVETIPFYLKQLADKSIEFRWIIVGNGEMATELRKNIDLFNLNSRIIWITEFIAHEDVLGLFSVADFYILLHRWSIFDFSTIEAMAYGVVPILSPIGGNLEVIEDGISGIFLKDIADLLHIEKAIEDPVYQKLSESSKKQQNNKFSQSEFIRKYREYVEYIGRMQL